MQEYVASFCIGCTACMGCAESHADLDFSDANVFGFPDRVWEKFCDEEAVLQVVGEAEVRARLQIHEPNVFDNEPAPSPLECAARLLQLEIVEEVRVRFVEEGRGMQRAIDAELNALQEHIEVEQLSQDCEDRRLRSLADEEAWAAHMMELRRTDTPVGMRDRTALKAAREDHRARGRERDATRVLHVSAKAVRLGRQRKHLHAAGKSQTSLQKLHRAGLRADMAEVDSQDCSIPDIGG